MISTNEAKSLLGNGGIVVDDNGDKIGKISQIFLDDTTGEPAWVTVKTGMFGGAESFVPVHDAHIVGDDISVPYDKAKVKDAPRVEDADGHLTPSEEDDLYRFYELNHPRVEHQHTDTDETTPSDRITERTSDDTSDNTGAGHDVSGPDTDSAMTRSEETLHLDKQTETIGKARLRKYIVTENVTQTVPVSHEEVRIEREPVTDANRGDAVSGGDITEEVHEVELKGERVAVSKETVPVERVRIDTDTVTEDQEVSEQLRKEQIEADSDGINGSEDRDR